MTPSGGRPPPSRRASHGTSAAITAPGSTKRAPAPRNGGSVSRPRLMTSQVLPQTSATTPISEYTSAALGLPSCDTSDVVIPRAQHDTERLARTPFRGIRSAAEPVSREESDMAWMEVALGEADKATLHGDVPIG